MTTIVVEDASVTSDPGYVVGANSYVSTATLQTYCDARNYTIVATDLSYLLIKAMDYIESLQFIGVKKTRNQPLQWPRYSVRYDGYTLDSTQMPQMLLDALCETAIAVDQGYDPLAVLPRNIAKIKVDEIEIEYAQSTSAQALAVSIRYKLWKLLHGGLGSNSFTVGKG